MALSNAPGNAPELDVLNCGIPDETILQARRERVKIIDTILPLTDHEAMVWCIETQIPECFKGYLLESI